MNIRFYSDPETGLPHIHDHGVTEDEVEEVLLNPGEKRSGSRRSKIVIRPNTKWPLLTSSLC